MTEAYIYDAIRSPRGKGRADGALQEVTSVALSAQVLDALAARNGLSGHAVEDVIWGNVTQIGEQGGCLARSAVLASGLDEAIPGLSINRFCASGLEAVNLAANQVRGAGGAYIAGGVEMMGRVPMGSDGAAIAVDPSLAMKTHFVPQGISADIIATQYGFTRDQADALAVESQRRAARAWAEGRFARSIVPVRDRNGLMILDRDEYMRPATDMQTLGALKPAFAEMGEGMPGFDKVALMKYPHLERIRHIHHAGNSSGIVDGAAAILIGDAAFGAAHGLKPRALIRATAKIGTDPTIMLTGPVPVTERILAAAGLNVRDIDLFEVNEAFAAVVLRFQQAFEIDPARVNPNGGAIAMGHPLGATGAIILGTLLDEMERTDKTLGLATLCVASGMGAATILEKGLTMPERAFHEIGDLLTTALLKGDFELYRKITTLPMRFVPHGDKAYELTDIDALREDFDLYVSIIRLHGVTDIYRQLLHYVILSDTEMAVDWMTHILVRANLLAEPFPTRMRLVRAGDGWRVAEIASTKGHLNWTMGRAEVLDQKFVEEK